MKDPGAVVSAVRLQARASRFCADRASFDDLFGLGAIDADAWGVLTGRSHRGRAILASHSNHLVDVRCYGDISCAWYLGEIC